MTSAVGYCESRATLATERPGEVADVGQPVSRGPLCDVVALVPGLDGLWLPEGVLGVEVAPDNAVYGRHEVEEELGCFAICVVRGPVDVDHCGAVDVNPEDVPGMPRPFLYDFEPLVLLDISDYAGPVVRLAPVVHWHVYVVSGMRVEEVFAIQADPGFLDQDDIDLLCPAQL